MKTIFLEDIKDVNKKELFSVYAGGIQQNATYYNETIEEIQNYHFEYLTEFLQVKNGILAVLTNNAEYLAALRILPQENNNYFCEAFEVLPSKRGIGLGKKLYNDVIEYLSTQNEHFTLTATTWKTNIASLKAHKGVGFEQIYDYAIKDGEKNFDDVTLQFSK